MRAAVAAAWVTGLLGLGAAGTSGAVEVLNAHANAPHANCAALVEKVSELGATNPALLHLYAKAHGKGLPRLENEQETEECGDIEPLIEKFDAALNPPK